MSGKSKFKIKLPKPEPRAIEELKNVYIDLKNRLADAQYQAWVYAKAVDDLSKEMLKINEEAAARNTLDAASKPETKPETQEVQNVQS